MESYIYISINLFDKHIQRRLDYNVENYILPLDWLLISYSCWPPLWSRGKIIASHLAGSGSIPDRVSFPGWGFLRGFSSTIRQMSGKLRPQPSPDIIGHHNHQKSFHTGANDLRCWRALNHKLIIIIISVKPLLHVTSEPGFNSRSNQLPSYFFFTKFLFNYETNATKFRPRFYPDIIWPS